MDGERCGDVTGEPYAFEVECILPKGHLGDHYAVATWPRWERPAPSTASPQWMTGMWKKALEHQLRRPPFPVVPRELVISRDEVDD